MIDRSKLTEVEYRKQLATDLKKAGDNLRAKGIVQPTYLQIEDEYLRVTGVLMPDDAAGKIVDHLCNDT